MTTRITIAGESHEVQHQERANREIARESQLAAEARIHAAELVRIANELRWGEGTPASCAEMFLIRAAREAGVPWFSYSITDLPVPARRIFDRDGWTCQTCGTNRYLTVDHIIARVNGGTDDPANLQTLCMTCNSRKGAK